MTETALLAIVAAVQVIALAWIAAWQQRAAREVRKLNGQAARIDARAEARLQAFQTVIAELEERLPEPSSSTVVGMSSDPRD